MNPILKAHMFLGMGTFFIRPFTRLLHVWSSFGTVAFVFWPFRVVRSRWLGMVPKAPLNQRGTAA